MEYFHGLVVYTFNGVRGEEFLLFFLTVDAAEETFYLHFTRQLHDTVYHSLGAGRTAGDVNVDGHDVAYALCHMVAVPEGSA